MKFFKGNERIDKYSEGHKKTHEDSVAPKKENMEREFRIIKRVFELEGISSEDINSNPDRFQELAREYGHILAKDNTLTDEEIIERLR